VGLPHARDFDIERFTGVAPFPAERYGERVEHAVVTFVLRDDRAWGCDPEDPSCRGLRGLVRSALARVPGVSTPRERQHGRVARFGEALRTRWQDLDLAVAGVGEPGGLPGWISDLRRPRPSPADERAACARYAASHVVLGVHGSNMLLPSAHAAACIEIAWGRNLGNAFQDLLVREEEARIALFRHRLLPPETTPTSLAATTASLLAFGPSANRFAAEWNDHERLARDPFALADEAWRTGKAGAPSSRAVAAGDKLNA
jgi:hypothetical protein